MPDEEQRPGTFAQQFLGRGGPRPARVLRPQDAPGAAPASGPVQPQLGLFGAPPGSREESAATTPSGLSPLPAKLPPVSPSADQTAAWPPSDPGTDWTAFAAGATQDVSAPASRRVWSVRALVGSVRRRLEGAFTDIWVEGEVSNCRPAPSGHLYLTLKDGDAQLSTVMFRREVQRLPFLPADGLAVLVRGRLSIFESRGHLQLIADAMEVRGAGALQVAFEQLKARLLAEGLFAQERKRALPPYPRCVGIITSPAGAVIRDIVTVIRRRHGCLNLLVYPVPVQGPACASAVVRAIRWFNRNPGRAELLVLARGGGSLEDLAGFNDETVVRAIAASELPVVSAIGHETDFTIADFVADLRAPTPSAAAEIITASQHRVAERIGALDRSVQRASRFRLLQARQRYARLSVAHVLARVYDGVARRQQRLDDLAQRLNAAARRGGERRERRCQALASRLERQSPQARLDGGRQRWERLGDRLRRAVQVSVESRERQRTRAEGRLEALSPVAVLQRGYALVYGPGGALISSAGELRPGQPIRARLARGSVDAEVTEIRNA